MKQISMLQTRDSDDNVTFEKLMKKNAVPVIVSCVMMVMTVHRDTSLKPVGIPQNKFEPVVDETSLNKTIFGDQSPIILINRNHDIAVKVPRDIKPFPCRRNIHIWNKTSALYTQRPTKTCKGIDSAYEKRNIIPRPHPSFFSNPGFWAR